MGGSSYPYCWSIFLFHHLHILSDPKSDRKLIVFLLQNSKVVKALCEIILNILQKTISVPKESVKYRKELINLADRRVKIPKKRNILSSKAGKHILQNLLPHSFPIIQKYE